MNTYAILKNNNIINVMVVDSQNDDFAQAITDEMMGDSFIFVSEHERMPSIGWVLNGDRLEPKQPYPSWIFDESIFNWIAPVRMPQDDKAYYWNEESVSWVEING